jgi:hypothetical protein
MSRSHRRSFGEAFVAHPLELRRSPAWRALPNNARRVLDRLEVEHMEHGGAENGSLKCPYSDFAAAGLRRPSIALALRQCVALGFLAISQQGSRAISNWRSPSQYRLTYLVGRRNSPEPTHEWRQVRDDNDAAKRLDKAAAGRNGSTQPRPKKQKAGHGNVSVTDTKTCLEPDTKTYLDPPKAGYENVPTIYISGRVPPVGETCPTPPEASAAPQPTCLLQSSSCAPGNKRNGKA